jgi:hypothetical protein
MGESVRSVGYLACHMNKSLAGKAIGEGMTIKTLGTIVLESTGHIE